MNNMILIRGGKIAFSRLSGNFSQEAFNVMDLTDMILMPYGLFLPCHDHGMQVFTMMADDGIFKPMETKGFTGNTGNKGVLIVPDGRDEVRFYLLRTTVDRQLNHIPLRTGDYGFAVISCYTESSQLMSMAVRLTETIEEAVDMYCRHISSNRRHVEIWDKKEAFDFLERHHKPKILAQLKKGSKPKAVLGQLPQRPV